MSSEQTSKARKARALAERARRLAAGLNPSDHECLLRQADELEQEAAELERQTAFKLS